MQGGSQFGGEGGRFVPLIEKVKNGDVIEAEVEIEVHESYALVLAIQEAGGWEAATDGQRAEFLLQVQGPLNDAIDAFFARQHVNASIRESERSFPDFIVRKKKDCLCIATRYIQEWCNSESGNSIAEDCVAYLMEMLYDRYAEALSDPYGERVIKPREEAQVTGLVCSIKETGWREADRAKQELFYDAVIPFLERRVRTLYPDCLKELRMKDAAMEFMDEETALLTMFALSIEFIAVWNSDDRDGFIAGMLAYVSRRFIWEDVMPTLFSQKGISSFQEKRLNPKRGEGGWSADVIDTLVILMQDSGGVHVAPDALKSCLHAVVKPQIYTLIGRSSLFSLIRDKFAEGDWPDVVITEAHLIIFEAAEQWRRPSVRISQQGERSHFVAYLKSILERRIFDRLVTSKRKDGLGWANSYRKNFGHRADVDGQSDGFVWIDTIAGGVPDPEQLLLIEQKVERMGGVLAVNAIKVDELRRRVDPYTILRLHNNLRFDDLICMIKAKGGWDNADDEDVIQFEIENAARIRRLIDTNKKLRDRIARYIQARREQYEFQIKGNIITRDDLVRIVREMLIMHINTWSPERIGSGRKNSLRFWTDFVFDLRRGKLAEYLDSFPPKK